MAATTSQRRDQRGPVWRRLAVLAAMLAGLAAAGLLLIDGIGQQAVMVRQSAVALGLAPHDSGAQRLAGESALISRDPAAAAAWARRALRSAPLDVRALRTLGMATDHGVAGQDSPATEWFNLAARLSWRDRATQIWLLRKAIREGDAVGIVQRADALLRLDELVPQLHALLGQLALDPAGRAALVPTLAENAPWRTGMLMQLPVGSRDHVAAWLDLLLALGRTDAPPRAEETGAWFTALAGAGYAPAAHRVWSALAGASGPSGGDLIADPDFADPTILDDDRHRPPFAWHVSPASGAQVDVGPVDDASSALSLTQSGSGTGEAVYQVTALAPGRYTLSFLASAAAAAATRSVRLTLSCSGGDRSLAPIRQQGAGSGWSRAEGVVEVPAGCMPQRLAVSLEPSGSLVSQTVAIRAVRIARLPGA